MIDIIKAYDEIRESSRAHWDQTTQSWYIGRFEDVWELLVSPDLGARNTDTFTKRMTSAERAACHDLVDSLARWPVFSDMPRHTHIHRLILPAFSQSECDRVTTSVRAHMRNWTATSGDQLDHLVRGASKAALAGFLGLAIGDLTRVAEWSRRIISFVGHAALSPTVVAEANVALKELSAFVTEAIAVGNSAINRQLNEALANGSICEADAVAIYAQMVTGFLQPTMSCLAAALEYLTWNGSGGDHFRADPDTFIAEAIRLASPFHYAPRRTLNEIIVGTSHIPAGERIVLLLVSANRDPRKFNAPLDFRMDRGQPPHVAFARGRYACIGAGMARQVVRAVLDAIIAGETVPRVRVEWNIGRGMRMAQSLALQAPIGATDGMAPDAFPPTEAVPG